MDAKVKTFYPNTFRTGIVDDYIAFDFGQANSDSNNVSDKDVEPIGRLMLKPEQILTVILSLSVEGANYQNTTGKDIGFAPFLNDVAGDKDE